MLHNYLVYSVVLFRKAAKESRIGKESPDGNIHTYHTAHELRVRRNLCSVFYASWRTWAHRTSHTTHKRCLRTRNSCLVVRMYVDVSDVFFRSCFPSSPFLIVLWSFYSCGVKLIFVLLSSLVLPLVLLPSLFVHIFVVVVGFFLIIPLKTKNTSPICGKKILVFLFSVFKKSF